MSNLVVDGRDLHQGEGPVALRFLTKAIRRHGVPEKVTIDASEANAAAIPTYNEVYATMIATRSESHRRTGAHALTCVETLIARQRSAFLP
jgi:transposase-like protein